MVYFDKCRKCGCAVYAGTHYCKSCASETDDWTGYIDISDIPMWVLYLFIILECIFTIWAIYTVFQHFTHT